MPRFTSRLAVGTAAMVASVGLAALPASASTVIGTSLVAKASATHVAPGHKFTINGRLRHGRTGLPGMTVYLLERPNSHMHWKLAKNTPHDKTTTGTKGGFTFTVVGLKHNEQYRAWFKKTTVGSKTYGASSSKVITIIKK